ncbi:uncharacterized protein TNCV_1564621 [Trichonephila clavipes]|nr:uncharacterized protein TNCV_1564621 [Trichonephila clavipes]
MDVCKCIVPSRHGGILNIRRAASPLVWLVEGEERWKASDHFQSVLPLNWGGTEPNCTVTCMVLKATANDRRHLALCHDELRGPRFGFCRSGGIALSIKFFQRFGKTPMETLEMLSNVYGESTIARSKVYEWLQRFNED